MRAADHAPPAILGLLPQIEEFIRLELGCARGCGLEGLEVANEVVAHLLDHWRVAGVPSAPAEDHAGFLRLFVRHILLQLADREHRARKQPHRTCFSREPRHEQSTDDAADERFEALGTSAADLADLRARLAPLHGPDVPLVRALLRGEEVADIARAAGLSERQVSARIRQVAKALGNQKPRQPFRAPSPEPPTSSPPPPARQRSARTAAFYERANRALKLADEGLSQRAIGAELHISPAAVGQLLRRARSAFSPRRNPPLA